MIVFRPFIGEIIVGKVKLSSEEGLQVSVGFFDQIWIPSISIIQPTFYDETDKLWAWDFEVSRLKIN